MSPEVISHPMTLLGAAESAIRSRDTFESSQCLIMHSVGRNNKTECKFTPVCSLLLVHSECCHQRVCGRSLCSEDLESPGRFSIIIRNVNPGERAAHQFVVRSRVDGDDQDGWNSAMVSITIPRFPGPSGSW